MHEPEHIIEIHNHFFAIARQLKRLAHQSAGAFGLTVHQIGILNSVVKHPGQTQKEITERLVFAKSRVSLHIEALVDKGLVTRSVSEVDRRETRLFITPAGKALSERYNEEAFSYKMLGSALERFNDEEVRSLARLNKELLAHLTQMHTSMSKGDDSLCREE
ncbi:MarR family winged helix-turn-helix transcriptional regulator [Paenibacillus sp. NFR01]|uniref:MarR family winged helix-turn-helix transcriptional regulator n=1 Tax=Paenibacillus sp. NFR01 TaxID=1566279 RepID=UPI0008AB3409|nr:MarR family winged helix-turn-helix transcriptional regulator [Paenibacillus sp. NFR01]SET34545.1 DNA-binding transcriptional regulator, MarR family [Paenibacillus sp. NFR01]